MNRTKLYLLLLLTLFTSHSFAFRVFPTTAQDERMLDKNNFPFIAANADGFNLQHDSFGPFSASQVETIFNQFTNKNLINHGVYNGNDITTMSTMNKLPTIANVTAFMLYAEAPALDYDDWVDALSQNVTWPLITHCRSYSTAISSDNLRQQILMTEGVMMEFQVTDPAKFDDAMYLMKYCVDNNKMVVFLTTFQETPDIFISAYKEFFYYLKQNLGASYLDSDNVIFVPNTYEDTQVLPETIGYGSTFGVAHWLIDQKTKTADGYIQSQVSITSPDHSDYYVNNSSISVDASVAGSPTSVKLYINGELVGEDNVSPYQWTGGALSNLSTGYYVLRVDAEDAQGVITTDAIRVKVLKDSPAVPGFFQADNLLSYDLRNDPEDEGYIRHCYGKEWIDYKLNVQHSGTYDVDVRLKVQRSKQYGGSISIMKGSQTLGSYTTVLNDPAQSQLTNFVEDQVGTISSVYLTAGEQTLRMYFSHPSGVVKPQFYLYDFNFKIQGAPVIEFTNPQINDSGEYPDYSAPAAFNIAANVSSPTSGGQVASVKLYVDDQLVDEKAQAPFSWESTSHSLLANVEEGVHDVKIVATDNKGYESFEYIQLKVVARTPYRSFTFPGTVQAYEYDLGGEGMAYHDFNEGVERGLGGEQNPRYATAGVEDVEIEKYGGKYTVTAVRNGEWLNYTAAAITSGSYEVSLLTSANAGKSADVIIWLNNKKVGVVKTETTAQNGFTTFKSFIADNVVVPQDIENATIRLEFSNPDISNYLLFFQELKFIRTGDAPASVSEPNTDELLDLGIYPNPCSRSVTIDLKDVTSADVMLFSMCGRQVHSVENLNGKVDITLPGLQAGIYLVKIKSDQKSIAFTQLIVK